MSRPWLSVADLKKIVPTNIEQKEIIEKHITTRGLR
jgi:hypothetical protein